MRWYNNKFLVTFVLLAFFGLALAGLWRLKRATGEILRAERQEDAAVLARMYRPQVVDTMVTARTIDGDVFLVNLVDIPRFADESWSDMARGQVQFIFSHLYTKEVTGHERGCVTVFNLMGDMGVRMEVYGPYDTKVKVYGWSAPVTNGVAP